MTGGAKTGVVSRARRAAWAAALLVCLPAAELAAQHHGGERHTAPHYSAPRAPRMENRRPPAYSRPAQPMPQYRGQGYGQYQYRAPQNGGARMENPGREQTPNRSMPQNGMRPAAPAYQGQGYGQQNRAGYLPRPEYAPPNHLGAWLNEHRNAPPQAQQRILENDPSFRRLPQAQQQRLMQQLNRVDKMPEAQRERRLARAENLERLSPQEREQVRDSVQRWRAMPADRQALMKSAFRDLRSVPPDQRQTVLNSSRYQNVFSPEERGILSNMLRVEPYEPPR